MFSEYRFVEVSNSMTFRPPQIHSLFFPASDFEKISKFSKPNHFYVVSNRVEVKRIFRFYRNMDEENHKKILRKFSCGFPQTPFLNYKPFSRTFCQFALQIRKMTHKNVFQTILQLLNVALSKLMAIWLKRNQKGL